MKAFEDEYKKRLKENEEKAAIGVWICEKAPFAPQYMPNRDAVGHVSRRGWACFAARLGIYRDAKGGERKAPQRQKTTSA